jgi:putative ABC transport system permease protein
MQLISLSFFDLGLAAVAVLALAATAFAMRLGLARTLLVAALRTTAQLALVGLVLEAVFAQRQLIWIALMALVMLLLAGREAAARQKRPFAGGYGFAAGTASMFLSSFVTAVATLVIVIRVEPWYTPQYAIPLLGMLLGNTMTGIALAMDRLTQEVWRGGDRDPAGTGCKRGRGGRRHAPRCDACRYDPDAQCDGRGRHHQPARHDDRPDPGR